MSDLREALKGLIADIEDYERVNNLAPAPGKADCWQSVTRAKAALSAQPQPEAVEAVFLGCPDHKAVAARLRGYANDPMWADHGEVPKSLLFEAAQLLTTPPLAPDARMRRAYSALQTFAAECHRSKWNFDLNEENPPNVYDARRLVRKAFDELQRIGNIAMHERDELKALSRADDGKESEGGNTLVDQVSAETFLRDASFDNPNCGKPSDPTPAEQREAIARIIYDAFPFDPPGEFHPVTGERVLKPAWVENGNSVRQEDARRAADRILALSTRAGG